MQTRFLTGALLAIGTMTAQAQTTALTQMEALDRGVVVVAGQSGGRFVSWRLLGTDDSDITFDNGAVVRCAPRPGLYLYAVMQ